MMAVLLAAAVATAPAAERGLALADALKAGVAQETEVRLQRARVAGSEGALETASGRFDPHLRTTVQRSRAHAPVLSTDGAPPGVDDLRTDVTSYSVTAEKLLHTGQTLSLLTRMQRLEQTPGTPAANRGQIALGLVQPLLRGRGAAATTAAERSARFDVGAAEETLNQSLSQSALTTANAYWSYVAAGRAVEIAMSAEARAEQFLKDMQALIRADRRPAADSKQVAAILASRRDERASAEQTLRETRHALGIAMGLPFEQLDGLLMPSDDFPVADHTEALDAERLIAVALAHRADLVSVRRSLYSAQALLTGARDGVRPQLDVSLNAGISGAEPAGGLDSFFTGLTRRRQGLDASVSLTLDWPTASRSARGVLAQSDALVTGTSVQLEDLTRRIRSEVQLAASDLSASALRVRNAHDAATLYRSATEDERQKLRLGLSTVLELLQTEDRLTASLLEEVSANVAHATALARLRFVTGTLVTGTDAAPVVEPVSLDSLLSSAGDDRAH